MIAAVIGRYAQVYEWNNLYLAWHKAAKGKRSGRAVAGFEFRLEDNLIQLQDDLANQCYSPGDYTNFTIHEPKRRLISAAPFRDRVVHHALCQIIEPAFERSFIEHSYANRIGKGTHRALNQTQQWLRRYKYVLQCDIKQFFPSIDHLVLQQCLQRRIQDGELRRLISLILASGTHQQDEVYEMVYFPSDDLFAVNRERGLPIGNLTSQFWANCYLNSFDHFVNRELRCSAYLRYVDDFLLFADDKSTLWQWRDAIVAYLGKLRLTVHQRRAALTLSSEGISFLGFRLFPTHRRLLSRKGLHYRHKLATLMTAYHFHKVDRQTITHSIQSWINHVRYGNTWRLRQSILQDVRL